MNLDESEMQTATTSKEKKWNEIQWQPMIGIQLVDVGLNSVFYLLRRRASIGRVTFFSNGIQF